MGWRWWWHKVAQYETLTSSTSLQEHFFTPAVFGEIIYENFLFDIPKILDLCVLFGKGNGQLLHKMIGELCVKSYLCFMPVVALSHFQHDGLSENIFTQQPSYYNDLDETVATVLQARAHFLHFTEKYPNVTIPNEKHIVSVGEYFNAL